MNIAKRRVVVTGIGLVSPLGIGTRQNWEAALAGTPGVAPITLFDASRHSARFAGEVKGFDPLNWIDKKDVKKCGRFIQFALAAAAMAMEDSRLQITPENAASIGVAIGSGIGGFEIIEREHRTLLERGPDRVSPFFILSAISNLAAGQVSVRYGAKGPNTAPATACTTGAHAIGDGFRLIQGGYANAMLCGGAEAAITPLGIAGFAAMRALSTRNDEPARASRPWDVDRDGFVVGEGAGVLVLEEYGHAVARNAPILAELVGYGMSADAHHPSAPPEDGDGVGRVMSSALADAGLVRFADWLPQCPRDVHAARRSCRGARDRAGVWRSCGESAGQLDEGDERSPAGRRRRTRSRPDRAGAARSDRAADHQPRSSGRGKPPQPGAERGCPQGDGARHDQLVRLRRHQRVVDLRPSADLNLAGLKGPRHSRTSFAGLKGPRHTHTVGRPFQGRQARPATTALPSFIPPCPTCVIDRGSITVDTRSMTRTAAVATDDKRWQRRPDDRPRLLMASALKLLKRRGYRRVRLEDVARDAGVCKATVYHYFANKDDLLTRSVASRMAEKRETVARRLAHAGGTASDRLRLFLHDYWIHSLTTQSGLWQRLVVGEMAAEAPDVFAAWARGLVEQWQCGRGADQGRPGERRVPA